MRCLSLFFLLASAAFAGGPEPNLRSGFINDDKTPLRKFLASWHAESKPVAKSVLAKKPQFERELYRLYSTIFVPAEFYKKIPYVLVQNEVDVTICDSDLQSLFASKSSDRDREILRLPALSEVTVKKFRPKINVTDQKVLYHDQSRINTLLSFLAPKGAERFGARYLELVPSSGDKNQERIEYLKSHFLVIPGHWGVGFHFSTHPEVLHVHFNRDFTRAVVAYREYYGGGNAYMETKDGAWTVKHRGDSWTE